MNEKTSILICDDEKTHADLVQLYLKKAGFSNPVTYYDSGKALLSALSDISMQSNFPLNLTHLIMLDIRMPKMNGFEVLLKLRATTAFKNIQVVMFTSIDDPDAVDECMHLGCAGYITKPIYFGLLIDTTGRVLSESFMGENKMVSTMRI